VYYTYRKTAQKKHRKQTEGVADMTIISFSEETESGYGRCKIIIDKKNCLGGNERGNKNYLVMPFYGKSYRVSSLIDAYKALKAEGYKVVDIF